MPQHDIKDPIKEVAVQPVPQKPDRFGLVDRARKPDPVKDEPAKIQPVMSEVRPEDTVESRITALTGADSKYMDVARQGSMAQANRRGLVNSTMAAGAGEKAAIEAALPIAKQDAATLSQARIENQRAQNEFLRNEQSAELNKDVAKFENDIRLESDKIMNDIRFSDQVKLNYTETIANISRDTQQQIAEIGMSDRSAEAQASAIRQVQSNRGAQLAVYQDMLKQFPDWKWSVDFTPEGSAPPPPRAGSVADGRGGYSDPNQRPEFDVVQSQMSDF